MMITVSESLPKLTEEDIVNFEREFEIALPSEYKEFLLRHNGGCVEPHAFKYSQSSGCSETKKFPVHRVAVLRCFFGIANSGTMTLAKIRRYLMEILPHNLFPIADTVTGNIICLSLYGNDKAFVYVWHHDEQLELEEGEYPDCENVYFVTENFVTFLNSLYEYKAEQ